MIKINYLSILQAQTPTSIHISHYLVLVPTPSPWSSPSPSQALINCSKPTPMPYAIAPPPAVIIRFSIALFHHDPLVAQVFTLPTSKMETTVATPEAMIAACLLEVTAKGITLGSAPSANKKKATVPAIHGERTEASTSPKARATLILT
mmetsp:Transcript_15052/g.23324  ORF Transcript_15052/g.23324 Transcript_15052/m.23324 type:complete len:149 (+) Transcript_15052:3247-3693(+)